MPGELCKIRAALGLVVASFKMARDLNNQPLTPAEMEDSLRRIEKTLAVMAGNSNVVEKLFVATNLPTLYLTF
jgi:hypothetical protein